MIQLQINRKIEDELSALLGLSQSEPVFELKWKILPQQTLVFILIFLQPGGKTSLYFNL